LRVVTLTPEIASRYNTPETEGVVVVAAKQGSNGAEAGVLTGDIIKEINHNPIKTVEGYTKAIKNIGKGESIQLFIRRVNVGFLVIRLTK